VEDVGVEGARLRGPTIEREARRERLGEIFVEQIDEGDPAELPAQAVPSLVVDLCKSGWTQAAPLESGDLAQRPDEWSGGGVGHGNVGPFYHEAPWADVATVSQRTEASAE
jgi:hypothetical protein